MKIEDQVCSLELAKKLKELGVRRNSYFWWVKDCDQIKGWRVIGLGEICGELDSHVPFSMEYMEGIENCPAYLASELGDMLPACIQSNLITFLKRNHDHYPSYATFYSDGDRVSFQEHDPKEADSRAKMLIYLIEDGHVKAEDL